VLRGSTDGRTNMLSRRVRTCRGRRDRQSRRGFRTDGGCRRCGSCCATSRTWDGCPNEQDRRHFASEGSAESASGIVRERLEDRVLHRIDIGSEMLTEAQIRASAVEASGRLNERDSVAPQEPRRQDGSDDGGHAQG